MSGVVTAGSVARAASNDRGFAVPVRPRTRRGVLTYPMGDGLVVDGVVRRRRLGGGAVDLVTRLLPLMDGTRDHPALAAALGITPRALFQAVTLLWTCGVVEEAAPAGADVTAVPDHLADFLSRTGDATAANAAWEQAAARLAAAHVEVRGDGPLAAVLATELGAHIAVSRGAGPYPAGGATLVVLATPTPDDEAETVVDCWRSGIPVLWVSLRAGVAHLGPYVDPRLTPCLACATGRPVGPPDPAGPPDSDDVALTAALAANEIFGLVGRATRTALPMRWRSVDLTDLTQERHAATTRPGCPACSAAPGEPREAPVAARYEAAVGPPPRDFLDAETHQTHHRPADRAPRRGARAWPLAPRTPLAVPTMELPPDDRAAGGVDLAAVGVLLAVGAGWWDGTPDRVSWWTATGGDTGPVVAYVVARDVAGLPAGVYGYLPDGPALARLGDLADGVRGTAPASIVLTADLRRTTHDGYGGAGLRPALLDAGCAQAAIGAAAIPLGLTALPRSEWDDEGAAAVLGVDRTAEPVTALIDLREPAADGREAGAGEVRR
ncbi:tpaE [Polymorphospora rubra]|uniref:tpaE n=1 Tax=Polymorphospora rubra TaxID=338584 RepID=UPI0033D88BD7